jgi:beta-1,4-mannosyl-glycoprotein beta-1,4-N-acetylglucosaminyltransferase
MSEAPRLIVDCFTFYNELDMLEYRLNVLDEVVDYFIIAEAKQTFTGNAKQLYFEQNKDRFKQFQHKLIHLVVDLPFKAPEIDFSKKQQWGNEYHQRCSLQQGLEKLSMTDQDVILVSDLDEIPDPTTLRQIKEGKIKVVANQLEMSLYYYNLHTKFDAVWTDSKLFTYKYLTDSKKAFADIRMTPYSGIPKGGWHLSYFGDERFVKNKIENFSHQEFNKPEYSDPEKIKQRMKDGHDLYGRSVTMKQIAIKDNAYLPPKYEVYLTKFYERTNKMPESVLEAKYTLKRTMPSDINEHLPTLRTLASECRHITEAGVRSVVSSYAFATALKGKADHTLVQVDLKKSAQVTSFQAECAAEGVKTVFYEESDLSCPLAETDLLFIDTWHIYGHLKRELARWHSYAKTYIVLHDTTVDEWAGETIRNGWDAVAQSKASGIPVEEINKGLWPAVEEFLKEHPEWHLAKRYTNNNGLTVLKRGIVVPKYASMNRPPVYTSNYVCAQTFVDFLLSEESPVREAPVHIGYSELTFPFILYNCEQMTRGAELAKVVKMASNPMITEVWDYSAENCKIFAAKGVKARHVPLVSPAFYVEQIKALRAENAPLYDVGFCGHMYHSPRGRRQDVLQGLRDVGVTVLNVTDYGVERDRKLALCRVILNIHFADDFRIFESARCDVWLRAGVPVVSETSMDDDPRCIKAPYGALVETTVKTVNALRARPAANDSLVLLLQGSANASLSTQTVDKSRIHLVFATKEPVTFDGVGYASVTTYSGDFPHEYAVGITLQKGSHLCVMEGRHKLESHVLQMLLDSKDKGVIAPMLVTNTRYSNYHAKVDANGYCVDDPLYDDLLYKRFKGLIDVPVVNGIYFVNHALLPKIKYSDGTRRDAYVIMSDALRKQGIPQYLDNRQFHGTIQ